ncbi:DUF2784 domain-containing protein [Acidobacteriia bacterium AH_259_A11_L15]|nr:DUF2784 domain-containing protein [Acidobacteriia bacterium AH_259_A11_L15]
MSFYGILALAALTLHLLWIGWVLLGWLVTRNRPWLRGFHLASLVYAILIETLGFPCPLTFAEQFFRRRAGLQSYEGSFLLHYLESLIYPDVSPALLTGVAVALCAALLALYALRFRRRHQAGW